MPSDMSLDVRVVLLGRTGLDAALRLDPALEIVRARTPLEAIGELAQAPASDGPFRSVVVVAPNVEGLSHDPPGQARLGEFLSAARVAWPGVVLLAIKNGRPPSREFDAVLRADAPPDALRQAVRWKPGAQDTGGAIEPVATPQAHPSLTPEHVVTSAVANQTSPTAPALRNASSPAPSTASPSPGDLSLVEAMTRGHDLLDAAMTLLRTRTSDPSANFIPGDASNPPDPLAIAVEQGGVLYGHLTGADKSTLVSHVPWLAAWLRLRDQHAQLKSAAFTDALTGAWNRRYFERFLASTLERARNERRQVTVMLFDIDDFKKYNDQYGHDAGDDILRETVRLLRSVIRPSDRVCRVGGDEFAVVFDDPEGPRQEGSRQPTDVFAIARRFQQQVLNHRFPKLGQCAPGTLTISGGLATYPWDGMNAEELLRRADLLAMESKRQGKNAITMGPGAMRVE